MIEYALNVTKQRTMAVKLLDYFLYFCIFGGITLVSGAIVHALEFSLLNVVMFLMGLSMTIVGTIYHDVFFVSPDKRKAINFTNYGATIITAVSSGSIAGAIIHWEEGPKFGLFMVVCGFIISMVATLLYNMKPIKEILKNYFIMSGMFFGMSFISGTLVHSINDWFRNYSLVLIGLVLTVTCSLLNESIHKKRNLTYFIRESMILLFLSLGIGCIAGGLLHVYVSVSFSLWLMLIGFIISVISAMFKEDGTLVELTHG